LACRRSEAPPRALLSRPTIAHKRQSDRQGKLTESALFHIAAPRAFAVSCRIVTDVADRCSAKWKESHGSRPTRSFKAENEDAISGLKGTGVGRPSVRARKPCAVARASTEPICQASRAFFTAMNHPRFATITVRRCMVLPWTWKANSAWRGGM